MSGIKRRRSISKGKITFFQDSILAWFKVAGRHHFPWREEGLSDYQIVIAEVLLQRTKAETVEKFYPGFLVFFPNWEAITGARVTLLEKRLRPIGLFRQRAKRLMALAREMVKRNGQFPREREALEQIPFLGQYIANAIELQLFHKPSPLVDVNMARVLERYFGERQMADIRYDPYIQQLAARVVNHPRSKEVNWAILDFAAILCKARKPLCEKCLLSATCNFYKKEVRVGKA
jgi:A/G-specific adenine glycosylase